MRYVWAESIESEVVGVMLSSVEDVAPGVIGSDVAFGSKQGRIVRTEDKDGETDSVALPACPRTTVVL